MEKVKSLNRYQKGMLLFMIVMVPVFAVMYSRTVARVGFEYKGAILVPSEDRGGTVYAGKIQGQRARFTVSGDKTVVFQYGVKTYGPYTAKEDPTAVPKDQDAAEYMTGVELREGEDILFRGGVLKTGDHYWLYNEDGAMENFAVSFVTGDGIERDENGDAIDPMEPFVSTILSLMDGPKLTHKGDWLAWAGGAFLCVLNALSVLFADELFRWGLSFQIRNADRAEPADWEIAGRYAGWTVLAGMALAVFIMGLR